MNCRESHTPCRGVLDRVRAHGQSHISRCRCRCTDQWVPRDPAWSKVTEFHVHVWTVVVIIITYGACVKIANIICIG